MKIRITLDLEVDPGLGRTNEADIIRDIRGRLVDGVLDPTFGQGTTAGAPYRVTAATSWVGPS